MLLPQRLVRTGLLVAVPAIVAFFMPSLAHAHLDITFPQMRPGNQKVGPCGGVSFDAGGPVTVLAPGSQLTIQIIETVPHPGHFRVMFDADVTDGVDFPDPTNCDDVGTPDGFSLLADKLLPAQGGTCPNFHTPSERTPAGGAIHEFTVTLPDIECENCALQVIQIMTDAAKADADGNWDPTGGRGLYFRCADVKLSSSEEPTPGPNPSPDPGNMPVAGGCSASGASSSWAVVLFALLGLAASRRRRRA